MFQNSPFQINTDFFGQKLTLQSGLLATQATASVLATIGGTSVLCAIVVGKESTGDYFPLQVIYEERYYAAGKIKSSQWSKREARPSDNAILTGRMIDRSLRSLFDPDIRTEIQVILTVLSLDKHNPPDTLAVLSASTAMHMCKFQPQTSKFAPANYLKLVQEYNITLNTQEQLYYIDTVEIKTPLEYINASDNQELNQAFKHFVSKNIQDGLDVVNSPSDFGSLHTPKNYLDYNLYRGPVASVRIGYTESQSNSNLLDSILPIYAGVNSLTELQALDKSTKNLLTNLDLNSESDLGYLTKINKILTQKSPQLGIYFKNIVDMAKENYTILNQGQDNGSYEINPSYDYLRTSDLDIVISGNGDNIVMVECGANIVDESIIAKALELSVEPIKQLIQLQNQFVQLD